MFNHGFLPKIVGWYFHLFIFWFSDILLSTIKNRIHFKINQSLLNLVILVSVRIEVNL